jgi:hypothetical protein
MGKKKDSHTSMTVSGSFTTSDDKYHRKHVGGKFSTSKRDYVLSNFIDVPGPGSYISDANTQKRPQKSKQKGFGSAERQNGMIRNSKAVPGPGNYNFPLSMDMQNRGFTMKGKIKDYETDKKSKLPGPGQYLDGNLSYTHKKSPSVAISKEMKSSNSSSKLINITAPGPGSYEPKNEFTKRSASKWKMSNGGRNVIHMTKHVSPGPGSYENDKQANKGSRFALSKRREMGKNSFEPGPGAYNTSSADMKKNPSFSMRPSDANQKSLNRYKESVPGPGTYEILSDKKHRKVNSINGFGSASRNSIDRREGKSNPGPGAYKLPSMVAEVPSYYNNIKPDEFKYT